MYLQRRAYARFLRAVVRVQRWARLRYCVVRTRRRHRAAAMLLLDFLQVCGVRARARVGRLMAAETARVGRV